MNYKRENSLNREIRVLYVITLCKRIQYMLVHDIFYQFRRRNSMTNPTQLEFHSGLAETGKFLSHSMYAQSTGYML